MEKGITSQNSTPLVPLGSRLTPLALTGAFILSLGVFLYSAFTVENDFASGALYTGIIGAPAMGTVFGLSFVLLRLTLRIFAPSIPSPHRRAAGLLIPCLILSLTLALLGYRNAQPLNRFRADVLDPLPPSLQDVQVHLITSFGGPHGVLYRFRLSDEDFATLRTRHHLTPIPIDLPARRRQQTEIETNCDWSPRDIQYYVDRLYPEDDYIRRYSGNTYIRPPNPQYFTAPGPYLIHLVRDPASGATTFLLCARDRDDPPQ